MRQGNIPVDAIQLSSRIPLPSKAGSPLRRRIYGSSWKMIAYSPVADGFLGAGDFPR